MAQENRALTGIRGVAALFVVVFHEAGDFQGTNPAANMLRHGYNAVDLFFVLSGFVMAMTYGETLRLGSPWRGYGNFLGKRLARIYPLYACLTIATFFVFLFHLSGLPPDPHLFRSLPINLLLVQSWGLAPSIVGPAWSVSTEWAAYLLFPALLLACSGRAWRPALAAAAATLALVAIAYAPDAVVLSGQEDRIGPLDLFGPGAATLTRCLAGFVLGMVAYRWKGSVSASWAFPAVLLILAAMAFPATDLLLVGLFALLVMSLAADQGVVARALGSSAVYRLGVLSYSIYLLHARFNPLRTGSARLLTRLHVPLAEFIAIAITVCVIVALAGVTFALVEKPGRNAVRRLLELRRGGAIERDPPAP